MVIGDERLLRAAYSEWPRSTPARLLEGVRTIEHEMAKHLRTPTQWAEVERIVVREFESLQREFPEHATMIEAKKEEWLGHAYEGTGRLTDAIASLEQRLRMRRPKPVSRENCYARLVDLLVREGRIDEAKAYAQRGFRYSTSRDAVAAEFIRKVGARLGLALEE